MLYESFFSIKRLWWILICSLFVSFSVLLFIGGEIYFHAPPIPTAVQTESGQIVYTKADIDDGQNIWQGTGGMQQGSIWAHGGYLAPDWSADWLNREAKEWIKIIARNTYVDDSLNREQKDEVYQSILQNKIKKNTYNPETGIITISDERAEALASVASHYDNLYRSDQEEYKQLREDYAFPTNIADTLSEEDTRKLGAFYFWSSWASTTNRPDDNITYTSNWPHEELVGNRPPPSLLIWSLISVFLLLGGIGAIVWYYVSQFDIWRSNSEPEEGVAKEDILMKKPATPSMLATAKYFWVVTALIVVQVLLGIVTAHYAVEGQDLYGFPIGKYFPYVITRTWHTQLAVLWIATAWLATGLYVAPLISGHEPKFQRFGVNFLFFSLLIIVVGSFAGQWMAVMGKIDNYTVNFWFGHQGYEYIDLGRFWQIYLFIGLLLWTVLLLRALWPAFKQKGPKSLIYTVVMSVICIGLLYGAGLIWDRNENLAIVEYWRWWVVHLWVEGIFEVFATAVISLLFVRMGLLRVSVATTMVLFATIIFLGGGVLGTMHHLYWAGTPISVMAIGSAFSALEVVPLMVVGFEAYSHAKIEKQQAWEDNYYWPFMFFGAVLFWNLVGAGLFGFLINPPIALYYMQGLNTTSSHGHAALFGVYGMLGMGLMLYCLRGLTNIKLWDRKLLKISFWSLNIGMVMMTFFSLFPIGILQTYQSIKHGYVFARSAEFIQSDAIQFLVWARVPGDVVFAVGIGAFALFVYKAFWQNRLQQKELQFT